MVDPTIIVCGVPWLFIVRGLAQTVRRSEHGALMYKSERTWEVAISLSGIQCGLRLDYGLPANGCLPGLLLERRCVVDTCKHSYCIVH